MSRFFAPVFAGLLLGLAACKEEALPPPSPVPVTLAIVERQAVPFELLATGTVEPLQAVSVQPQISGPIVRVAFREGQAVEKGREPAKVPELLIILAVVLLLFGGSRLAGLGKSTGRALKEFKEETKGLKSENPENDQITGPTTQPPATQPAPQNPVQDPAPNDARKDL